MTRTELDRAEFLLEMRRAAEAETTLRGVLAQEPESAAALRLLAQALLEQDRAGVALEAANRSLSLTPDSEHAHRLRALCLSGLIRHPEAVRAAKEALHLAPHSWQAHVVLSGVLLAWNSPGTPNSVRMERAGQAVEQAREGCRLGPHEADTHIALALALTRANRPREADSCYREALSLEPGNPIAMNNLAALHLNRGRLRSSSELLSAGLSADPNEGILRENLDTLVMRLVRRIYFLAAVSGISLAVLAQSGASRGARVTVVVILAVLIGVSSRSVFSAFGSGARRWMLSVWQRLDGWSRWSITLSASVTALAATLAVLPSDSASDLARAVDSPLAINLALSLISTVMGSREE